MVGGADLVFEGQGSGGGPIGNGSSGLIAFPRWSSTFRAPDLATGLDSALGLVLGSWGVLQEWVGGTTSVGIF